MNDNDTVTSKRNEAIRRVDANADPVWKAACDSAIRSVALRNQVFTTDEVWELLESRRIRAPHQPKAIGPRMTAACYAGMCVNTGEFRQSNRPSCNGRCVAIYTSCIWAGIECATDSEVLKACKKKILEIF